MGSFNHDCGLERKRNFRILLRYHGDFSKDNCSLSLHCRKRSTSITQLAVDFFTDSPEPVVISFFQNPVFCQPLPGCLPIGTALTLLDNQFTLIEANLMSTSIQLYTLLEKTSSFFKFATEFKKYLGERFDAYF
ncbi:hypothetical protein [Clostridium sp. 1001271st1 H5]|jgi:hypothetical protein|uniref:hypothetical protein n=1 Tax=Clostridium sp. 1001271st1 H5 TaxID=2559708 RepID=UPI001A9B99E5|nr:hypothetical protein [Clostridium sp. 1001271st1 H5]